jgi:hypothetical protein
MHRSQIYQRTLNQSRLNIRNSTILLRKTNDNILNLISLIVSY